MRDSGEYRSLSSFSTDPALRFQRAFLLLLLAIISFLFLKLVSGFVLAVLLAAIFAGMFYPLFRRISILFNGRQNLASITTILLVLLGIVIPLGIFLVLVISEAVSLSQAITTWVQSEPDRLNQIRQYVERFPLADRLIPESEELLSRVGEIAGKAGAMAAGKMAALGRGTMAFFLQLFVFLYAMFFFLVDGPSILRRILYYIPLSAEEEGQLLERFVSVTRATLKGSLFISAIQGGLAGLAFWATGVPAPAFWGTVATVIAILPAVGAPLVWVPAVIFLMATGKVGAGTALLVWCALVVSSVDNFLRPRLVGRDARMSDLLILISTLGGISVFGALGFIIGPIIAALFVTVWHIYGEAFKPWLPEVPPLALSKQVAETVNNNSVTPADNTK